MLLPSLKIEKEELRNFSKFLQRYEQESKKQLDFFVPQSFLYTYRDIDRKFLAINKRESKRLKDFETNGTDSHWSLSESLKSENRDKSRYRDISPFDFNRVKLACLPGESDYINASEVYVDLPELSLSKKKYVVTQGPLPGTQIDFWQMCYNESDPSNEEHEIIIVMLTAISEGVTEKCSQYWPDGKEFDTFMLASGEGEEKKFRYDLELKVVGTKQFESFKYSSMTLTPQNVAENDIGKYKPKKVHHFYFTEWSDFSDLKASDHSDILSIAKSVWSLNKKSKFDSRGFNSNPVYVHCSAGVGRSGTFIATDYLLNCKLLTEPLKKRHEVKDSDDKDIVETIVERLRCQRLMMVQSRSQYRSLYEIAENLYMEKIMSETGQ